MKELGLTLAYAAVKGRADGYLLDAHTGKELGRLPGIDSFRHQIAISFASDGLHVVGPEAIKRSGIWRIFSSWRALVAHAKRTVPRCFTPDERVAFFLRAEPPDW